MQACVTGSFDSATDTFINTKTMRKEPLSFLLEAQMAQPEVYSDGARPANWRGTSCKQPLPQSSRMICMNGHDYFCEQARFVA